MKVSEVSNEDGIQLACVIKALGVARFDNVSSKDMDALSAARRWLYDVAQKVAGSLGPTKVPSAAPVSSTEGMKIKAMGPIGAAPRKKKK